VFRSQALLSLSIAAIASWLGIERSLNTWFTSNIAMAERAFTCAAIVGVWRVVNRVREFERVFDHFIANLVLWGGLILVSERDTRVLGALVVVGFAAVTIGYGFAHREELFALYAFVYAVIAVDALAIDILHDETLTLLYLILSSVAAIIALFVIHARFRRMTA
jgi:hypothetical protein